jgi:hypothetical protein
LHWYQCIKLTGPHDGEQNIQLSVHISRGEASRERSKEDEIIETNAKKPAPAW